MRAEGLLLITDPSHVIIRSVVPCNGTLEVVNAHHLTLSDQICWNIYTLLLANHSDDRAFVKGKLFRASTQAL